MGTRSRIGIERKDSSIESIYCHYDGYLEHNGLMLYEHYNSKEKVEELINLGDISVLYENITPDPKLHHSFENSQENVVVAYTRDRKEKYDYNKSLYNETIDQYKDICKNSYLDFGYLYKDDKWYVFSKSNFKMNLLEDILLEKNLIRISKEIKL